MFQRSKRSGFTIIELMLAMSFVSILLVSIAMLTIQIGNIYTRGLTMKEINQAGTDVSQEIRRTTAQSYASNVKSRLDSNGRHVLCTGEYSYIANNPDDLEQEDTSPQPSNLIKISGSTKGVRLAKVRDSAGAYCNNAIALPTNLNNAVELLGGGDRRLVVSEMTLSSSPAENTNSMLYTVKLTLRTGAKDELLSDSQCLAPVEDKSNAEYCAINSFNIVVRVGNGSGGN